MVFPVFTLLAQVNNLIRKGNDAYTKQQYDEAIKQYQQALMLKQKQSDIINFNLGNALYKKKTFKDAATKYTQAIEEIKQPTAKANAYYNLAMSYLRENNLQEAIKFLKESLKINPADTETRENLQKALNELKKQQEQNQQKQQQKDQKKKQEDNKEEMNKKRAEELFNQLKQSEKQMQQQLQKQKTQQQQLEKDW